MCLAFIPVVINMFRLPELLTSAVVEAIEIGIAIGIDAT